MVVVVVVVVVVVSENLKGIVFLSRSVFEELNEVG